MCMRMFVLPCFVYLRQRRRGRIAVCLCLLVLLEEFGVNPERISAVPGRQVAHWDFEQSPVTFVNNPQNDVGKRILFLISSNKETLCFQIELFKVKR